MIRKIGCKLENLDNKIKSFQSKTDIEENIVATKAYYKNTSFSRLLIDLISGLIVGFSVGYICDKYFNTLPIFLFIFIIIGTAAGFYNSYKNLINLEN